MSPCTGPCALEAPLAPSLHIQASQGETPAGPKGLTGVCGASWGGSREAAGPGYLSGSGKCNSPSAGHRRAGDSPPCAPCSFGSSVQGERRDASPNRASGLLLTRAPGLWDAEMQSCLQQQGQQAAWLASVTQVITAFLAGLRPWK